MAIKDYYELIKPYRVFGNVVVASAAFVFASQEFDWKLFLSMLLGLSLIVASANTLNNWADRRMDARMERTKNRALAAGRVERKQAILFGGILIILGIVILYRYTNLLALGAALAGFVIYVLLYTPLKARSPGALFVGALAGAMPPVVGYVAVTNEFDLYVLMLFLALFIWQIPHFLAISVYRYEEYTMAGVPLFIKRAPSEKMRRRARIAFHASLAVLLLFCVVLVATRLLA